MALDEEAPNVAMDLAFWYQGLVDPDYPIAELGRLSLELATKFRGLAAIQLLTEGSTDLFLHNLMRAGRARRIYLQRLADAGVGHDHFRAAGWYAPLLDAIAAGDLDGARTIAALTPQARQVGEYEDDHYYARLVQLLIEPGSAQAALTPLLDAFAAYLDGQASPRFDLVRALGAGDQAAFDDAFAALLVDFEQDIEKAKARGQHEDPVTVALRHVCVEALALLRIAELRGLTTADEYAYCPSLARRPLSVPFPEL